MVRLAGRERQGWKARLDQSDWVDGSSWTDGDPGEPAAGDVEFLETEPSAYRLSNVEFERQSNETPLLLRLLGFGAVGVILLALAIMSRPGGDPVDELSISDQEAIRERQQAPADPAAAESDAEPSSPEAETAGGAAADQGDGTVDGTSGESGGGSGDGGGAGTAGAGLDRPLARELAPIPPIRDDLPPLPGAIFGFGVDSSIIRIDRTLDVPQEVVVPPSSRSGSDSTPAHRFGSGFAVVDDGVLYGVDVTGGETRELVDGTVALPANDGRLALVTSSDREQMVRIVAAEDGSTRPAAEPEDTDADEGEDSDEDVGWRLGRDVEVLGAWGDRLLVGAANRVWLLDRAGRSTQVTSGRVLSFTGSHLVVLDCPDPTGCRIEVGPPDQPTRRSVPVPETLTALSVESWGTAVDVSPDGDRLALRSIRGVVALPVVVDLVTGEEQSLSDSMNHSSPVVFSPDGNWLAYSFSDDIVVMNLEQRQRWRVFTERRLDQLSWLPSPELDAALEAEPAASGDDSESDAESDTERNAESDDGSGGPQAEEEAAAVEDGVGG